MVLNFGLIRHNYEKYLISSEYEIINYETEIKDEKMKQTELILNNLIKDVVIKIKNNERENITNNLNEKEEKNNANNNETHNFFKFIKFIF